MMGLFSSFSIASAIDSTVPVASPDPSEKQEVRIPDIGGHENVDVIAVEVKAGDFISIDDTLLTLETDKATMDVPSDVSGIVETVYIKVGDKVSAGSKILSLQSEHTDESSLSTYQEHQNNFDLNTESNTMTTQKENTQNLSPAEQLAQRLEKQAFNQECQRIGSLLNQSELFWLNKSFLLDTKQKIIWNIGEAQKLIGKHKNQQTIQTDSKSLNLENWHIPTIGALRKFSRYQNNPARKGSAYLLWNTSDWLAQEQKQTVGIYLDSGYVNSRRDSGCVIECNTRFQNTTLSEIVVWAACNDFSLSTLDNPNQNLLASLQNQLLQTTYTNIDYNRCRLPKLDNNRFTDIHQGMWEFCGLPEDELKKQGLLARNPALDVRPGNIGIDFGTSSTVVAYEDENGRARLLRVGVDNFYAAAQPEHYENPTVLEFIDFENFLSEWQSMAHQPLVSWDSVRCSHEALHNFRHNDSDPKVVASILGKIKQWALREADDIRVRFKDRLHGHEHELDALTLRNPVKGEKLQVSEADAFDPIELYAWFLGLNINWRGRGIFLKYYMTFPVAYPKDTKEKILSSFRRGLLRSLPEALSNNKEMIEKFEVCERASEPAAYVAAAMQAHKIEPTEEGVAYAVFDFGGGTTDFDFGYYRWANEEEEAAGIETVFEHFEAAGDKFLGGENLLENLAYRVFRHNLDDCRQKQISFTKPLDADDFPGSELLLERTQAAYTNTLMLMSRLRPFWEQGKINNSGIEKIDLITRQGEKVSCELRLPQEELQEYLDKRIGLGIENFMVSMKKAFGSQLPRQVHILLAGNASRSRLVTDHFGLLPEEADDLALARRDFTTGLIESVFGDQCPEMTSHTPLAADSSNESIPTAKTGVALGILRLCPGSSVKVVNHAAQTDDGEAPFAHYVGNIRRNKFQVGINRNAAYGDWHALGAVIEGVFNLYHTQSNVAHTGNMEAGHSELYKKRIDFAGNCDGQTVFARAIRPNAIELCCATDIDAAKEGNASNIQELSL